MEMRSEELKSVSDELDNLQSQHERDCEDIEKLSGQNLALKSENARLKERLAE